MTDRNRDFPSHATRLSSIPRNWTESDVQVYLIVLGARILTTAILRSGEGPSFLIALVEPYPQDPNYAQTCKTYQFPAQCVAPRLAFGAARRLWPRRENTHASQERAFP